MWTSVLSTNPTESDATWEAYGGRVNSKISKLKNFVYKVFERNFRSWFVPTMEAIRLRGAPLCLLALEIMEEAKETEEDYGHTDIVMEDTSNQMDR